MKEEEKNHLEEEDTQKEEEIVEPENSESAENSEGSENADNSETPETPEEKDPLEAAQEEIEQLKTQILYKTAEFDNYRKRIMKEKAEIILNGSAGVITDILPVIDDLERCIANSAKSEDFSALKEGIELIFNKLMHTLEQKGLEKISPKNEPFDTDFHEAIAMIPAPSEDLKGKVLDCAIDGYKLNDKVLRHAKVAVGE